MNASRTTTLDLRPAADRGVTELGWLHSRHAFSFGGYRDPARDGFRALRVLNDDVVEPGGGFGEHPHRDMEILTWVLDGALKHGDSLGHMQTLHPGELQAMTAGRGIRHSEMNASDAQRVHFLQIWLTPRQAGVEPRYDQQAFDAEGRQNQWQTLASGYGHDQAMPIDAEAVMRVAELTDGGGVEVSVEPGRAAYVHVARGQAQLDGQPLGEGDAVAITRAGRWPITAGQQAQVLWFDLG